MAPKKEQYRLFPLGHENDPAEERFPLSTLDYLSACTYNNYAAFFELSDDQKPQVAAVLKEGLEWTLSQSRHLVGTIQKNATNDDHSFVKKSDSSVEFNVQWLDSADSKFPSIADLSKAEFASSRLGDVAILSVDGMTYGEQALCSPDANPTVAAYQANFIPGGMIFNMHHHHYANDILGWAGFVHQLADNCRSIFNKTAPPPWDPVCLDHSQFITNLPSESKVDGPSPPDRNPALLPFSSLLFHLPKSKAAALKTAASPEEGWISTYDAFSAFLWRMITKHRANVYQSHLSAAPLWGEAVNMRSRLEPPVPYRTQGNVFFAALTSNNPTQLTTAEVISEMPLSRLATDIRKMTDGTTQEGLNKGLEAVAPIRDKSSLFIRVNSFAPMTVVMTDWRDTKICEADFGFGKPKAYRHLFSNTVTEGLVIVYPPRVKEASSDEGCEFVITLENTLIDKFVEDPEVKKYFEFRGYEKDNRSAGTQ